MTEEGEGRGEGGGGSFPPKDPHLLEERNGDEAADRP